MNNILEKAQIILDTAYKTEKRNNYAPPEMQRQYAELEDIEWLVDTLKELLYEKQEKLNACINT